VDTQPRTDELRQRVDAWLSEVSLAGAAEPPLPDGAAISDVVAALREREKAHMRQARALMELTAVVGRRAGDLDAALKSITETCARSLGVARVSVWQYGAERGAIGCVDLYEPATDRHSDGIELKAVDFPEYFRAIATADLLVADDAMADPRTSEFAACYLDPLGITSMLDASIHVGGALAGVICCEHIGPRRRWTSGEKAFVIAVANLVSLAMEIEEIERARRAVRDSELRFRAVTRALTDTIWDWDLVADTIWWSDGIRSHFGHAVSEIAPPSSAWSDRVHADDRERVLGGIRDAIESKAERWTCEYRFMRRDGSFAPVADSGVLMFDDSGKAIRMVGGLVDISDRKLAEAELVRARTLAEEASRAKTEFLANMSHEMRTPLTAVLGFSDLLMDPTLGAGDRLDYIQSIRRNGAHLLTLIDDVLDLSSMDSKVANLQRIDCSLHRILNEVASMMQVRASYKGLRFSLIYETPIPSTVVGDPDRIRQILLKLVGNAIKFTDSGEIRVVARLRLGGKDASAVEIDVADTGIGISPEDMSKVFHPFWQANTSMARRHGGSGLGLPICLPLARAMGGDILLRSKLDRGSVFTLRLPHVLASTAPMVRHPGEDIAIGSIAPPTPAEIAEADALIGVGGASGHAGDEGSESREVRDEASGTETALTLPSARILLAEDGPDNQLVISAMLRKRGFDVTVVENGVDAVERALLAAASGRPFHIILMDMQMPRLDGYGATALLRSRGYERPIFALTAHAMPEERKRCIVAGCNEFLSKPVQWSALLATIDSYLIRKDEGDQMNYELSNAGEMAGSANDREPIHSTLADDADMAELVSGFVERLPTQLIEIRDALHRGDQDGVRRLAHQLKGAGGSYGFDAVSESAALLEQAVKDSAAPTQVEQRVDEFEALCARVRSGPSNNATNGATSGATSGVTGGTAHHNGTEASHG